MASPAEKRSPLLVAMFFKTVRPSKPLSDWLSMSFTPCAVEQGHVAGANMSGKKRLKFDYLPHFSSTVFDLHFDFIGDFSKPATRFEIEGDREKKKFLVRHYILSQLMGVTLCNKPPEKIEAAKTQLREWPRGKKAAVEE